MYSASAQPTADQPAVELTIIVPTRNESDNIAPLLDRLGDALADRAFEVLFVDDSTDHTPAVIRQEAA
ncbi:MAG TPA: glycosyltransferase, partial [Promineifilum sp.]|nr:glycosyltransferase [Promineifilum sp.]